jgi:acetylornithine/N-succinyldiaminopimelate aminotransferase
MAITPLMPVYPRSRGAAGAGRGGLSLWREWREISRFRSGIAVNLLGHGHPHLTKAIQEQAATLMHVSNLYGQPAGRGVRQRLVDLTFADTVFFTNSGAEAVECAIKTARRYHHAKGNPHKHTLITFSNAFHGRTMATISATNQPKIRDGFAPLLPGFTVVEFDNLEAAKAAMDENTAGFLVEPIQGEGGIRPASQEFMTGLRALCDEHDLMLVLDEVQCGVARTGTLYATSIMASRPTSWPRPRASAAASRWAPAWRPRRPRRAWSSARTARPMAAIRSRWPRARRCSTSSPTTNSSPTSARWASGCARRWSR